MCGIALVVSGVDILGFDIHRASCEPSSSDVDEPDLLVGDLKDAVGRRGPDGLGSRRVLVELRRTDSDYEFDNNDYVEEDVRICFEDIVNDTGVRHNSADKSSAELYFLGATLQLRGVNPICQPLVDPSGNILVFNGEIFGGIHVSDDGNDAETLLHVLESCCTCNGDGHGEDCSYTKIGSRSVPETLSVIKGPWALVYWQQKSRTIWFGRDAFGRRSLLVHWPTLGESRFILSSVSPTSIVRKNSGLEVDTEVEDPNSKICYWEELPCGIYNINLRGIKATDDLVKDKLVGDFRKHRWTDPLLNRLLGWDRTYLDPTVESVSFKGHHLQVEQLAMPLSCPKDMHLHLADVTELQREQTENGSDVNNHTPGNVQPAEKVLNALRKSVMRRTVNRFFELPQHELEDHAPVALLFSGGLDSMILAAILHQCLDSRYTIDLLNVSFDGQLAPDRISARIGVAELQKVAPLRRWRLVEIDAILSNLTWEVKHLVSLINPAKTYMDLNIGIALWLAAGGDGWVDGALCNLSANHQRYKYKSTARILLAGSGADEQCAGYGRHITKYRLGGWIALHEEMRLDVRRIWKRNMGRDDRCISDHGKEGRFPFLDEDVIETLLNFPLWDIAELDKPVGIGDKKILREVARLLGLEQAAKMPKRAIQFGSRIARESNRKNFGSNRAANQASAGRVDIRESIS